GGDATRTPSLTQHSSSSASSPATTTPRRCSTSLMRAPSEPDALAPEELLEAGGQLEVGGARRRGVVRRHAEGGARRRWRRGIALLLGALGGVARLALLALALRGRRHAALGLLPAAGELAHAGGHLAAGARHLPHHRL